MSDVLMFGAFVALFVVMGVRWGVRSFRVASVRVDGLLRDGLRDIDIAKWEAEVSE